MAERELDSEKTPAATPSRSQVTDAIRILALYSVNSMEHTTEQFSALIVARWLTGWLHNEDET